MMGGLIRTFRYEDERTKRDIERIAKSERRSVNFIINRALEEFIRNQPKKEKP